MSADESQLIRTIVKVTPVLEEQWKSEPGSWWRKALRKISRFSQEHIRLEDKAEQAPELLWRAGIGYATEKHAKATADYAKAENDRIEAELKRQTLQAKAEQEKADADRKKTESRIARLTEIQGRLDLVDRLKHLGVDVTIDVFSEELIVRPCLSSASDIRDEIIDAEEQELLKSAANVTSVKIVQTS